MKFIERRKRPAQSNSNSFNLFSIDADDAKDLPSQIDRLQKKAAAAKEDCRDLALEHEKTRRRSTVRAAVVASHPSELGNSLEYLKNQILYEEIGARWHSHRRDIWVGSTAKQKVAFLIPGQGSQTLNMGRILVERYSWARKILNRMESIAAELGSPSIAGSLFTPKNDSSAERLVEMTTRLAKTEIAQPALVLTSVLYAEWLKAAGVYPSVVGGNSLGELVAFHLAGAFDQQTLFRAAVLRGQLMKASEDRPGAMLSLFCDALTADSLLTRVKGYATIANLNSPVQTLVGGDASAIDEVASLAIHWGIEFRRLQVSNAFHSELVRPAAVKFKELAPLPARIKSLNLPLVSSLTSDYVETGLDLNEHFSRQIVDPVNLIGLIQKIRSSAGLYFEVGQGQAVSNHSKAIFSKGEFVCLPVSSKPDATLDMQIVLAAAYASGFDVSTENAQSILKAA